MHLLIVHAKPLSYLGGAELSLRLHVDAAPLGVEVTAILPDELVSLNDYDTVLLCNLRPEGGVGTKEECRGAWEWAKRLKGYAGYVIKMEHYVHPCKYRDARCIDCGVVEWKACHCISPVPWVYKRLYNLCDSLLFLSPLHRRAINHIIKIKIPRQYVIGCPIDFDQFRSVTPFEERKHAALITGDAIRVAPEAVALAAGKGYPVETVDYLSVPYEEMPELLNQYKAVVVAPVMLHAFGRLAAEAMACGCEVITNGRVGAMSYSDPIEASRNSDAAFWDIIRQRPEHPNPQRMRRWRI